MARPILREVSDPVREFVRFDGDLPKFRGTEDKLTGPRSVLILVSFHFQVTKLEEQGSATGKKRQLSRRELEEELGKVKRVNRNFYKFAVEELMKEVHKATDKDAT